MDIITIVGTVAAICSTTSFAPQAWKIIQTRDTSAISAAMYTVTVIGFAFWAAYGFLQMQWPIIITNSICFALSGFILIMKLLPQAEKNAIADSVTQQSDS